MRRDYRPNALIFEVLTADRFYNGMTLFIKGLDQAKNIFETVH
jgi:hypothetical protein